MQNKPGIYSHKKGSPMDNLQTPNGARGLNRNSQKLGILDYQPQSRPVRCNTKICNWSLLNLVQLVCIVTKLPCHNEKTTKLWQKKAKKFQ